MNPFCSGFMMVSSIGPPGHSTEDSRGRLLCSRSVEKPVPKSVASSQPYHVVGRDRRVESLQDQVACARGLNHVLRRRVRPLVEENLPVLRFVAQTGGQIRYGANGPI